MYSFVTSSDIHFPISREKPPSRQQSLLASQSCEGCDGSQSEVGSQLQTERHGSASKLRSRLSTPDSWKEPRNGKMMAGLRNRVFNTLIGSDYVPATGGSPPEDNSPPNAEPMPPAAPETSTAASAPPGFKSSSIPFNDVPSLEPSVAQAPQTNPLPPTSPSSHNSDD